MVVGSKKRTEKLVVGRDMVDGVMGSEEAQIQGRRAWSWTWIGEMEVVGK